MSDNEDDNFVEDDDLIEVGGSSSEELTSPFRLLNDQEIKGLKK